VWIDRISIPGLSLNNGPYGTLSREGFTRPSGTATHAIEFGVVLTMLLPIALARAAWQSLHGGVNSFLSRWVPPAVIVTAIALSVSRSALVGAVVGVAIVILRLAPRMRALALAGAGIVGIVVFVTVPGMLGSVLGLFTGIGTDTSAQSRIDSYAVALPYIAHAPLFGRGMATFLPRYRIFDNQYLLSTVEIGIIGTTLLLAMFIGAIIAGHRVGRIAPDADIGLMAQGLAGGIAAGAISFALFDALSFPMVPGLLFLFIGLVGALRRLADPCD
jgi:O-antigen ligase